MANTIVIGPLQSQGEVLMATGTVNGVYVQTAISRTILNSLATAILAQQYVAFMLLNAFPQNAGTQLAAAVTPGTVNL